MKSLHPLLVVAFASTALASCAQTPTAAEPEPQRLARELRTLIGPASCTADSQCRSLPVGAKACGGPTGYLAWSTKHTDEAALKALVAKQTAAQRHANTRPGLVSDCAVLVDPGARCEAGRCVLLPPGAGKGGQSTR
ncbi:MAG: hypothetical protein ACT6RP_12010 [Roseateles sp.]|uniref:hypothetical protein n=1 Tax=Roseateles sp. TaxID=1971397 RepID=UPI00403598F6